jgi:hypothetical protein
VSDSLPAGFVDPRDPAQVAPVLAAALKQLGLAGLVELLARVPGLAIDPGRPGGALRRAIAPSVVNGTEVLRFTAPASREHVVGGIVLSRAPVTAAELPGWLAGACRDAVTATGDPDDASIALTAARDAMNSL